MNDYPVGAMHRGPYIVSLLSGNVEEQRFPTYPFRFYRQDIQVFYITEPSAIIGPRRYSAYGAVDNFSRESIQW